MTRRFDCTPAAVRDWAELAHDPNPLHLDPEFAATTRFGVPIAHGHLLAAVVVDELEAALGDRLTRGGSVSVRFREPVPVGSALDITTDGGGDPPTRSSATVAGREVLEITVTEADR